ncbi:MAG: hypothetical protein AAF387_20250, partial [Pseudomonadota bacterium]
MTDYFKMNGCVELDCLFSLLVVDLCIASLHVVKGGSGTVTGGWVGASCTCMVGVHSESVCPTVAPILHGSRGAGCIGSACKSRCTVASSVGCVASQCGSGGKANTFLVLSLEERLGIGPCAIHCCFLAPILHGFMEDSRIFDDLEDGAEQCCV